MRTFTTRAQLGTTSALAMMLAMVAAPAQGQDIGDTHSGESGELAQLRDQLDAMRQREEEALLRVEQLERRLLRLEQIDAEPISPSEEVSIRGRFTPSVTVAQPATRDFPWLDLGSRLAASQEPQEETITDTQEVDRRAPAPTAAQEDVTEQQQGVFGRRMGFEMALTYSHFDNARINLDGFLALDAIFLGSISIDRVTADIFALEPSFDIGLSDRLFADVSIPLLSRHSNFQSGGAGGSAAGLVERSVSGTGIGDASVGLSYRIFPESSGRPDVVFNTRFKFPTGRHPFGIEFVEVEGSEGNLTIPERLSYGSGVYGASAGISLLKTLDPMIVFASGTYFHNFPRSFDDVDETPGDQPGRVNLGNAYQLGGGLAFALNDRSSISMSYTQRIVERTELGLDGEDFEPIVGSQANVALVNIGAAFSIDENISIIGNVGIGLTDDSPDMTVGLRVPYRF